MQENFRKPERPPSRTAHEASNRGDETVPGNPGTGEVRVLLARRTVRQILAFGVVGMASAAQAQMIGPEDVLAGPGPSRPCHAGAGHQ